MTSIVSSRVKLVRNTKFDKSGLNTYARALRKYGITPTFDGPFTTVDNHVLHPSTETYHLQRSLVRKAATGQNGTVPADDIGNDSLYLAEVDIGTPAQKLNLDFDTGSADLWVWSSSLSAHTRAQGKAAGHHIFDPASSKTWKDAKGSSWKIQYGDNSSASGSVGKDTVKIGGITFSQQTVETASQLSSQFVNGPGDGLLGLAFSSINTVTPTPAHTPIDSLPKPIFTAYLGSWRDTNEADKGESFYTFGSIDAATVGNKKICYTPVDDSQGFWQFDSPSLIINGQKTAIAGTDGASKNTAIADTGTTLALLDDASVSAIYKAIPNSRYDSANQGYVFPSNLTEEQLPVIELAVGNDYIVFQKEDLGFADAGNGMVYGSIQSRGNMPMSIFGDAVLKAVYAIFDQGNRKFGFVQRIEGEQNLSPPPAEGGN